MPLTSIVFYQDGSGESPVMTWLRELRRRDLRAFSKCRVAVERLSELGHELRRPAADYLRGGIYELRVTCDRVNYRLLYFFHGRQIAVLAAALTKQDRVPPAYIERALRRKRRFARDPDAHTYREDESDGPHD